MLSSDPQLLSELVIYVYYQYRQQLSDKELLSAIDHILDGTYQTLDDNTLEKNLGNNLLGDAARKNSFSADEAVAALKSLGQTVDRAAASGHEYLADMVMRNYKSFLPLLMTSYSDMLASNRTFASIHNHFEAQSEIYRASCYMIPGTGERAEERFDTIYSSPVYTAMMHDSELRNMEFLQWYCTMFVIPAVGMLPPDWYMATFGRLLSDRVRPIFKNVVSQRNSVFTIPRFQKNRATFVDVISGEEFDVRVPKALDIPSGPMIEATLIRNASAYDINSMLKLLPESDASEITQDIKRRREAMSVVVSRFAAVHGHAVMYSRMTDAVSAYNSFVSEVEYPGKEEMGVPLLLNGDAFGAYPDYRAALLCEENNFYISLHYPLLMDVMEGSMHGKDAAEVVEMAFENQIAVPFTSLKRLFFTDGARLLSALRVAYSNIDSTAEMGAFIQRSRGHTFLYSPVPLFSRLRNITDIYVRRD